MHLRSRCTLHVNKLNEFRQYCETNGWVNEPTKGPYEVLRLRHKRERDPLIVHQKNDAVEHLTTWGISQKWVQRFIRDRKANPQEASHAA